MTVHEGAEWISKDVKESSVPFPTDQVVVSLQEEWGYRNWMWFTGMSIADFIKFWEEMETVKPHFHDPSATLPGELNHFRWGDLATDDEGETIGGALLSIEIHKYEEEKVTEIITYYTPNPSKYLWDYKNFWRGHIHMDDDSGVDCPATKTTLQHKGYKKTDFVTGASD
jgi:hypothetical protein